MTFSQMPPCGTHVLRWKGDALRVVLNVQGRRRPGRAMLRTNLGGAAEERRETIDAIENGVAPLARAWRDIPMSETAPGRWECVVKLSEVGVFLGKTFFAPEGGGPLEWPDGKNFHVKVEPEYTRSGNAIYTVFPRQFGSFREVVRRLPHIMDDMGFSIVQTLPPFPVPTTYAVMGEYGCPFAATDFFSVDPAMAEFDESATPLDQFRELVDAVHARGGALFIDLPANHTGWASALQTHHPEWFRRESDGRFRSPGAWGVVWQDLVELDYSNSGLCAYMADVFIFWCRQGVDGFRCDAGYMIPASAWCYIVARVREQFPDAVFMLEGLGGKIETTDFLLSDAGLDWAYSEIFQTYDRSAFEHYLPGAIARAETLGTLVHFAETHDNDRLAKGGETYARMRVSLAALLSHQGAWGIANGVEWFCREKIDVHGANDLNWGAERNMVSLISRLNTILKTHSAFGGATHLSLITRGGGNVLAVLREHEGAPLLVLVNLDCANGATVKWDVARFSATRVRDLLTDRALAIDPHAGVSLAAGEVVCLEGNETASLRVSEFASLPVSEFAGEQTGGSHGKTSNSPTPNSPTRQLANSQTILWHWPQDLKREVCIPDGCRLEIDCPHPCRTMIVDGSRVCPELPPYEGDGTAARRLALEIAVFTPDGVKRGAAPLRILPPARAARAKLEWSGAEARAIPDLKFCLGNGANAAAYAPVAWGEVRSQYDALFAANTNPRVPADRLVLWTRCRAWLQHEGYSREINRDVLAAFRADPGGEFAEWRFDVPCGMGRTAAFLFTLSLARGANAARLAIKRVPAGRTECGGDVRLVLRPDLEWRSFHSSTKAQGAVETAFNAPGAMRARDTAGFSGGFEFRPYGGGDALAFTISGGEFHREGEWSYCVPHQEDAERGQEPCGDLYSPGWISCDFDVGSATTLTAEYVNGGARTSLRWPKIPAKTPPAIPVRDALEKALDLFIVRRDDVKTCLAGYPWFLDWGRDTFIFLRGAIAAGKTVDALAIVRAFARFEENGTLPNIIHGETAGNRDTTDAQLWFAVAVRDLEAKTKRKIPEARKAIASIVENYAKGTPNGIRVDAESGLVWSPSHFTWMDTNYPACTPRAGYPVEIQALWIATLRFAGKSALAKRAAASLVSLFANGNGLADCLDAPEFVPARHARRDDSLRPNQLFAVTLDALPAGGDELAAEIVRACSRLVVPGGIRSLDAADGKYRGIYVGDEDSCRKPAYHNGTVWAWPFPSYAEAAVKCGVLSRAAAMSLLSSAVENMNSGCACHVSEIADGDAPHAQKGCKAQAWSASELLRVWLSL